MFLFRCEISENNEGIWGNRRFYACNYFLIKEAVIYSDKIHYGIEISI